MPYLNVDVDYFTNRKVVRLVGLIGVQHVAVPIRLWAYVGKHHCEDGSLAGYSKQEIESILAWKGKRGELVNALHKVGFLDCETPGCRSCETETYRVHDWLDHAGHLAALKERGKRNAEARWKKLASGHATSNASEDATSNAGRHAGSDAPTSLPIPTKPPNLPSQALGMPAPSDRKCARRTAEGPCQEYAVQGSKYCQLCRVFYQQARERKEQELQRDLRAVPAGQSSIEHDEQGEPGEGGAVDTGGKERVAELVRSIAK